MYYEKRKEDRTIHVCCIYERIVVQKWQLDCGLFLQNSYFCKIPIFIKASEDMELSRKFHLFTVVRKYMYVHV